MTTSADISARRVLLLDAGIFIAALDRSDQHHLWAKNLLPKLRGRAITCEACITETIFMVESQPKALTALFQLLQNTSIVPISKECLGQVFDHLLRYAPKMDYADGCLVALQQCTPDSIVITTDHRDFSTYRIPFMSPEALCAN